LRGANLIGADLTNANLGGTTVISATFNAIKGRDTIKGLKSAKGKDQAIGLR